MLLYEYKASLTTHSTSDVSFLLTLIPDILTFGLHMRNIVEISRLAIPSRMPGRTDGERELVMIGLGMIECQRVPRTGYDDIVQDRACSGPGPC